MRTLAFVANTDGVNRLDGISASVRAKFCTRRRQSARMHGTHVERQQSACAVTTDSSMTTKRHSHTNADRRTCASAATVPRSHASALLRPPHGADQQHKRHGVGTESVHS